MAIKFISTDYLRRMGACEGDVAKHELMFPGQAAITPEYCLVAAREFTVIWFVNHCLPAPARERCAAEIATADKRCAAETAPAWEWYAAEVTTARKRCAAEIGTANKRYAAETAPAWERRAAKIAAAFYSVLCDYDLLEVPNEQIY